MKLGIPFTLNISTSGRAWEIFKKNKMIYIKKSTRWVQSGICNFFRSRMTTKRVKTVIFKVAKKLIK